MTMLYKRAVADKDVYVESQDVSWSHTVTFAVNKEIGWKVVGDYVFCGDKQLYVVDNSGPEPSEGWVKASDGHIPFGATYSLVTPAAPSLESLDIIYEDVTIYYVAGETWRQAIANHSSLNAGWSIYADKVVYNDFNLWNMDEDRYVNPDDVIGPFTGYDWKK